MSALLASQPSPADECEAMSASPALVAANEGGFEGAAEAVGMSAPMPEEPAAARPNPMAFMDPSWSAGRKLAEARRFRGLTLADIEKKILLRPAQVEALETMNLKLVRGRAYAIAYLRSYAELLGLDRDAIVRQFQEECALSREDQRPLLSRLKDRSRRERPWVLLAVLGVMAGGFIVANPLTRTDAEPAPSAAEAEGAAVAAASPGLQDERALALQTLEFVALAPAWLEVRGSDGTIFFSEVLQPGQAYRPDPGPGWTVHARDGAAFSLRVHGRYLAPLGEAGQPVLGRPIHALLEDQPDEVLALGPPAL